MRETCRRRPGGYRGPTARVLDHLEKDAMAALAYARELLRRARAGQDVMAELEQESIDALIRAKATRDHAGKGVEFSALVFRILRTDGESAAIRAEAMFPSPADRPFDAFTAFNAFRARQRASAFNSELEGAARFIAENCDLPAPEVRSIISDPKLAKQAYYRAAKKLHPDHGGDDRQMQRLVAAYQVIQATRN